LLRKRQFAKVKKKIMPPMLKKKFIPHPLKGSYLKSMPISEKSDLVISIIFVKIKFVE
jgi:hypothetical protein